jgi:hypothetical protein
LAIVDTYTPLAIVDSKRNEDTIATNRDRLLAKEKV